MKKVIIALLVLALALSCVGIFFGCKKKEEGKGDNTPVVEVPDFYEVLNKSKPATKIVTLTAYKCGNDTLEGEFVTVIVGDDTRLDYTYDRFNTIEDATDNGGDRIVEISGHIIYKDGYFSVDEGKNWGTAAPSVEYSNLVLNIEKTKLHDAVVSEDGKTLTAKIYRKNIVSVLGVELDTEVASLTVTTDGNDLRSVKIEYTTASGDIVVINTSYTYDDHDVSDLLK